MYLFQLKAGKFNFNNAVAETSPIQNNMHNLNWSPLALKTESIVKNYPHENFLAFHKALKEF